MADILTQEEIDALLEPVMSDELVDIILNEDIKSLRKELDTIHDYYTLRAIIGYVIENASLDILKVVLEYCRDESLKRDLYEIAKNKHKDEMAELIRSKFNYFDIKYYSKLFLAKSLYCSRRLKTKCSVTKLWFELQWIYFKSNIYELKNRTRALRRDISRKLLPIIKRYSNEHITYESIIDEYDMQLFNKNFLESYSKEELFYKLYIMNNAMRSMGTLYVLETLKNDEKMRWFYSYFENMIAEKSYYNALQLEVIDPIIEKMIYISNGLMEFVKESNSLADTLHYDKKMQYKNVKYEYFEQYTLLELQEKILYYYSIIDSEGTPLAIEKYIKYEKNEYIAKLLEFLVDGYGVEEFQDFTDISIENKKRELLLKLEMLHRGFLYMSKGYNRHFFSDCLKSYLE